MLRIVRRALAIAFTVSISLLFLDFTGTVHRWLGWLAKAQFMPAVLAAHALVVGLWLVTTLLLGRVYCACVCPLGVLQDLSSWIAGRRKKNRFRHRVAQPLWRYLSLGVYGAALLLGIGTISALVEPYGAYGRIVSAIGSPVYLLSNNLLAVLAVRFNSYAFYSVDVWLRSVSTLAIALTSLITLAILSWKAGRLYCNTICPVGAILGLVSRFAVLKPRVNHDSCNGCGLCAKNCKASCIDPTLKTVDYSRCVACMNCTVACPQGAIKFRAMSSKDAKPNVAAALDTRGASRRQVVMTSIAALFTVSRGVQARPRTASAGDGGLAVVSPKHAPSRKSRIVPPGSRTLHNFEVRCTGCQLCVSVCPNQVLRPSNHPLHLMQPESSFEKGYCRPECVKCSEQCPSGAIHPVTVPQKSAIQVGHAVWQRDACIILVDHVHCGACARHCPTGAIRMVAAAANGAAGHRFPSIDVERCIGCGACEYYCPARPQSAIYVEGHERHRLV